MPTDAGDEGVVQVTLVDVEVFGFDPRGLEGGRVSERRPATLPQALHCLTSYLRRAMATSSKSRPCQKCSTVFDWSKDECPNCGWDKQDWIDDGRYGLEGQHTE